MTRVEAIRAMVQDAINSGASTVEEVHKKIVAMPLAALKNVEGLGEVGQSIEDLTNTTSGTIYDTIRQLNAQVGQVAKQMLEGTGAAGGGTPPADGPARTRPTAQHGAAACVTGPGRLTGSLTSRPGTGRPMLFGRYRARRTPRNAGSQAVQWTSESGLTLGSSEPYFLGVI
jgi:hypothetical protein